MTFNYTNIDYSSEVFSPSDYPDLLLDFEEQIDQFNHLLSLFRNSQSIVDKNHPLFHLDPEMEIVYCINLKSFRSLVRLAKIGAEYEDDISMVPDPHYSDRFDFDDNNNDESDNNNNSGNGNNNNNNSSSSRNNTKNDDYNNDNNNNQFGNVTSETSIGDYDITSRHIRFAQHTHFIESDQMNSTTISTANIPNQNQLSNFNQSFNNIIRTQLEDEILHIKHPYRKRVTINSNSIPFEIRRDIIFDIINNITLDFNNRGNHIMIEKPDLTLLEFFQDKKDHYLKEYRLKLEIASIDVDYLKPKIKEISSFEITDQRAIHSSDYSESKFINNNNSNHKQYHGRANGSLRHPEHFVFKFSKHVKLKQIRSKPNVIKRFKNSINSKFKNTVASSRENLVGKRFFKIDYNKNKNSTYDISLKFVFLTVHNNFINRLASLSFESKIRHYAYLFSNSVFNDKFYNY